MLGFNKHLSCEIYHVLQAFDGINPYPPFIAPLPRGQNLFHLIVFVFFCFSPYFLDGQIMKGKVMEKKKKKEFQLYLASFIGANKFDMSKILDNMWQRALCLLM